MTTVYASEDTYALSDDNTPHGNVSDVATIQNVTHTGYAYFKFDLSAWAGKTLSQGLIKLYISSNELTANTYITFKRITGVWDESTLKWSNKPATTDTNKKVKQIFTTDTGWKTFAITELLQDIIDNSNCCGVFAMLDVGDNAGVVWYSSSEGAHCPKLDLTEQVIADYYVKTGGNDALSGGSWANAWATVNKVATTVPDGSTVHIEHGIYNAEPVGNKIAPQNAGAVGIAYKPEIVGGGAGVVTVKVDKN
jgi:hypothetical protein